MNLSSLTKRINIDQSVPANTCIWPHQPCVSFKVNMNGSAHKDKYL